jgi:hypothetical protein
MTLVQEPLAGGAGTVVRPGLTPTAPLGLAVHYGAEASPWDAGREGPLLERAYELLAVTDGFEIWAIHWPPGGHLELHDHGDSSGAFFVVRGSLREHSVRPDGSVTERLVGTRRGRSFGLGYVHDVASGHDAVTTSVHAYAPPMERMTFYRAGPDGLVARRTEHRSSSTWAP